MQQEQYAHRAYELFGKHRDKPLNARRYDMTSDRFKAAFSRYRKTPRVGLVDQPRLSRLPTVSPVEVIVTAFAIWCLRGIIMLFPLLCYTVTLARPRLWR
jgi:hypothetical protein